MTKVTVRGQALELLVEGALYWPAEKLLAVADFHLGKSETFGLSGQALPARAQNQDLERLLEVHRRVGAQHLVFLGDLIHSRAGLTPELERTFADWMAALPGKITLVLGNHDRGLAKHFPANWSRLERCASFFAEPFEFRHEPPDHAASKELGKSAGPFLWAGHVHPCVTLSQGADRLRLKAFVIRQTYGLLPAFSSLAGGHDIRRAPGTQIFGIGDREVHDLTYGPK